MSYFVFFVTETKVNKDEVISLAKNFDMELTDTDINLESIKDCYVLNCGSNFYGVNSTLIVSSASGYNFCKTYDEYLKLQKNKLAVINGLRKSPDYNTKLNSLLRMLEPLNEKVKAVNDRFIEVDTSNLIFDVYEDADLNENEKRAKILKLQHEAQECLKKISEEYKYYETLDKIYRIITDNILLYDSHLPDEIIMEQADLVLQAENTLRENFKNIELFIKAVLKKIDSISVISHFGHDLIIPVKKTETVYLSNFSIEALAFMEYNTLLKITR